MATKRKNRLIEATKQHPLPKRCNWFERQPPEVQAELIGAREALRSGELENITALYVTARDMYGLRICEQSFRNWLAGRFVGR